MAKISHGANTWSSEGLAKKYKAQENFDSGKIKHKSKKDTNKWCKGKVGREHELIRTFYRTWNNGKGYDWEYHDNKLYKLLVTRCLTCGKEFWHNKGKTAPLIIPVRSEGFRMPVQVKVNGKAIPIEPRLFTHHWCESCERWELN